MNPRNTWRWIAVAAVLLSFIFFYQRRVGRNGSQPARVLPHLKAAAVTSVQIRPGARAPIRAHRIHGVWQLVAESLVYPAQATSIETLLAALERLTPAPYITARELRDRLKLDEAYGFSTPQATIAIEQPEHTAHLLIGARTPPGDQVFLQVVGMDGVFMVDADFLKYIPRTAEDWRDTTLVDLKGLTFDRLAVTNGAKVFELRRDRSEEHTSELQSRQYLVCRLLLEKK